jgi:hypothetical protein
MDPKTFADATPTEPPAAPPGGFNEVPQGGSSASGGGGQDQGAQYGPKLPNLAIAHEFFSNPDQMYKMAQIYYKHGLSEGLDWLNRGREAAKENVFEALGRVDAGDMAGAAQAFNRSGRFNDVTDIVKNDDGTITANRANGPPATFNPDAMRKSLLSYKDYFAQQQHEQSIGVQKEHNRILSAGQESLAGYQKAHGEALKTQAAAAEERALLMGQRNDLLAQQKQDRFSSALEVAGVKADSAREIAEMRGSPVAVRKKIVEDLVKNLDTSADPSKAIELADKLTRFQFVDVHQNPDGNGFLLVDKMGGPGKWQPVGSYPDRETANAAKLAYISGKNLPPGAAAPTKLKVGQRTLPEPPPDQPAGPVAPLPPSRFSVAGRQGFQARKLAMQSAADEGPKAVQAAFDADKTTLAPLALAQKYDAQRGNLSPSQLRELNAAMSQVR